MSSVKYCSEVLEQEIDSDHPKILYYDFDKDNISIFDGSYDIKGSYSDYYMNLNFNLPYERSVMLPKSNKLPLKSSSHSKQSTAMELKDS